MSQRKFVTGISIIIIIIGGYFGYQGLTRDNNPVQYVTVTAAKGTLVLSISGSGQVSVSDQVDIKPKVSGEVIAVYVEQGQEIRTGALIIQIDSRDAQRAVRDAETNLETAELELDKLLEPIDELDLLQAENDLIQAKESKQKAEDDIEKAYEDGFNAVSSIFLDLPTIMVGLHDMLFNDDFNSYQWNIDWYADSVKDYSPQAMQYKEDTSNAYSAARTKYDQNFRSYKDVSRYADDETIEALINETCETSKDIADAVKSVNNFIDFYEDQKTRYVNDFRVPALVTTHQNTLDGFTGIVNNSVSSLLSVQHSIKDSRDTVVDAERSIKERELMLARAKDGPDELDIRAREIAIQQKQDALLTAKQNLADYFVRAPFNGIVAEVDVRKGDSVSSGTTLITLISEQKIAEITLNEVDVAQAEIGQLATLTFDAVEDVTLTGKIIEIDTLGAVTQGVVTYNVKIAYDTQDERIKPGMTANASIIIERKDNVVLVPNAAVQLQEGQTFVEIMRDGFAQQASIEAGLSNEISTEIISGLLEGVQVITARLEGSDSQTANTGQSFGLPGMGGGTSGRPSGGGFMPH